MNMAASARRAAPAVRIPPAPTEGCDLPGLLETLRSQPGSAHALAACLPPAVAQASSLHAGDRCAWMAALREARTAGGLAQPAALAAALALAERWSDWPLVGVLCADLERMTRRPEELLAAEARAWVLALHGDGRTDEALVRCRHRMLACPQEAWTSPMHAELCAWRAFAAERGPAIEGEGLRLEPLGHQHLQAFAWQYHDPEIAALCCLPRFADDGQWHAWLDRCWGYGDQRLYAVLHPDWGFVGSVSLIECMIGRARVGFFYYWLGPDFQGHGLGPRAVRLLLAHARDTRGLRSCHAKVFQRNRRSQRALEKLGFRALPVRGIPPFDDEIFYRLGLDDDARDDTHVAVHDSRGDADRPVREIEELRLLLECMDAETRLAAPLVAGAGHAGGRRHRARNTGSEPGIAG